MNKTKIIATIGPSSEQIDKLRDLITSGVDIIRLNLAHANYEFCEKIIDRIHQLNQELNRFVSIMVDTEGPSIRVGKFTENQAFLKKGDKIRIYMKEVLGDHTKFSINYPKLVEEVKIGTILKLEDGRIELEVIDKGIDYLLCLVNIEGIIHDNRNVTVVDIETHQPFLSKKDKEDIVFAHKKNIDFIALSFVRSAEDVLEVNDMLIELGNNHMSILAKVECESALEELDEIMKSCEGLIVARGDLGVEIPMEKVPAIQKTIINKCHMNGKVSVVATELMTSMEHTLRPTRAEVSDIANAVLDGTDAIMLTGETTIGEYPIETVQVMEKIIASAEIDMNYFELLDRAMRTEKQDTTGTIAYSVTESANRLKCKAIIAPTNSGYTAKKMSRFRPICPIIAVSPNLSTVKSLTIYFGVHPILIDELDSIDGIMNKAKNIATNLLQTQDGDKIIITGGYPFKDVKHTNFMKIEEL